MGALSYDGTNDRGTVTYNAAFEPAQLTMGMLLYIPTGHGNSDFDRLISLDNDSNRGWTWWFAGSGNTLRPFIWPTTGIVGVGDELTYPLDTWFWVFLRSNTTGPSSDFYSGTLGGTVSISGSANTTNTRATGTGSTFAIGGKSTAASNFGRFNLARMFIANVILTEQEMNSICFGASPINVLQARGALNVYYDMRPYFSGQPDLAGGFDITHGGATQAEGPSNLLEPVDSFPLVLPYSPYASPIRVHPVGIGKGRGKGGGGNPNQPPTQNFIPIPPGVMGYGSTAAPFTPGGGGGNPTLLSQGVYWHTGIFSEGPYVGVGWSSTTNLTDGSANDTTTRETSGDASISILTVGTGDEQLDQLIAMLRYKGNIAEVYKEWTGSAYEDIPIDIAAAFPPNATYTDGSGTTIFDTNSETIRLYQFTESDAEDGGMSCSDIRETLS